MAERPNRIAAFSPALELSWGREPLQAALSRPTRFRRFKAADVCSILEAGPSAPNPAEAGEALRLVLPESVGP